ncbi:hypothetical protein ACKS0A_06168 [Histoplasma ohiense]
MTVICMRCCFCLFFGYGLGGGMCTIYAHYPGGGRRGGLVLSEFFSGDCWGELQRTNKSHIKKTVIICMIRGAQTGGVYGYTVHGICYAFSLGRRTAIFHHGMEQNLEVWLWLGAFFEEEYQRDSWDTP